MDVTVAASGPCRKTLRIKIPPERIRTHLDEVYQSASQQVRMKGFRPGKIPRKVLEQRLGNEILAEAKESLINRAFQEALQSQKLAPIGRPEIDGLDNEPLNAALALEYQVHFDVRPEIELDSVRGIPVSRGDPTVTDADIQSALNQLADQKRSLKVVEEPAQDGDFVRMDMTFKDAQGEVIVERKGVQLTATIPIAGTDATAFASALRGAVAGQAATLEITFPATFEKEAYRGQKGTVDLAMIQVMRVAPPPIDDALAAAFQFDSLAAMQEELRKSLDQEKKRLNKLRQEEDLINHLLMAHPYDLPMSMVEDQTKVRLQNLEHELRKQNEGADDEVIKKRVAELEPEVRQQAERGVRAFFLFDAIARKEKLFVTEGDVDAELRNVAQANNATQADVRAHFEQQQMLPQLRLSLMERKVRDFLSQHAAWTD